jgi:hypothetical protein
MIGSLVNNIMSEVTPDVPEIGMGVTRLCWSDRNAFTVIDILSSSEIRVQRDRAKRVDNNGMSDCQTWEFQRDPNGSIYHLTLRKNGRWKQKGVRSKSSDGWLLGTRQEHFDFSF